MSEAFDEPKEEKAEENRTGLEIAVVGLAGRFPGAPDTDTFWRNLRDGEESISFFTPEELTRSGVDPELTGRRNYVAAAGVVEGIELFDAAYFGFTPREAELMDPQHRIFLELVVEALEQAGYASADELVVGVYAGAGANSYFYSNLQNTPEAMRAVGAVQALSGIQPDFLATRVSYKLNLRGPSFTVQTACSTSLVAVHVGCQALLSGECDVAVAGGVSFRVPRRQGYLFEDDGILSPDGHCRAFDVLSRGTVPGSGAGVVVLRRLVDAEQDGDPIRAVIRGSVVNNDGSLKAGFTAPSVDGQAMVVRTAHLVAEVEPETISYIETHGTGTPLGDPIEVAALRQAFDVEPETEASCALGSVKTNVGHLDAASGVASLIKTVLALEHRQLPPSLHFEKPNPQIDFDTSPFYVNTRLRSWETNGVPRRAGVSSFGIGGTNAHVIVEEAPEPLPSGPSREAELWVLSAKTPSALERLTDHLAGHLPTTAGLEAADAAFTLQVGRWPLTHRRALVASGLEEAVEALSSRDPERLLEGRPGDDERGVFFLFSGLGEQYAGMGRQLYEGEIFFREAVDECREILRPLLGVDILEILHPAATPEVERPEAGASLDLRALRRGAKAPDDETPLGENRLTRTAFAHPAVFVIGHALARLWRAWGLEPQGAIGYSLGEYLAACEAEVFTLEEALLLVAERARLINELPEGRMLAVPVSRDELLPLLGPELSIAAQNAPSHTVVAGAEQAVAELEERLADRGVVGRLLKTRHAFHSSMMEGAAERFREVLARVRFAPPSLPFISNVTGTWIRPEEAIDPDYWVRHLLSAVRFSEGVETLLQKSAVSLLEVGPGRSLGSFVRQHADPEASRTIVGSLPAAGEGGRETRYLLRGLAQLWLSGVPIDWHGFHRHEKRCRVALPTYPFERRRYWIEPAQKGSANSFYSTAARQTAPTTAAVAFRGPVEGGAPSLPRPPDPSGAEAPIRLADSHPRPALATPYVPPRTALEAAIAGIWQHVLGMDRLGVHDDFFELGGHSLLATRVLSHLLESLHVELSLGRFFAGRTIVELARAVDEERRSDRSKAEPPDAIAPIAGDVLPGGARAYPVSFSQERLWFLDRLAPGSASYNVPVTLALRGSLDVSALWRAFAEVTHRHQVLRATFHDGEGGLRQVIAPSTGHALPVVDLGRFSRERRQEAVQRLARADAGRAFDLARGPLLTTVLLRLDGQEHVLLLNMHHIVSDAESFGILLGELAALYPAFTSGGGGASPLREPSVQYADFAAWQRRRLEVGAELHSQLAYWTSHLAGLPALDLPTDRPRPAIQRLLGDVCATVLEESLLSRLATLQEKHGASRFMLLLALFKTLLFRYTGRGDVVVGTTLSHRNRPELEGLIGLFVNLLVLRTDLRGADPNDTACDDVSFERIAARVRDTTLAAFAHQDLPFERLVEALQPQRDLSLSPLFQVLFAFQHPGEALALPGLTLEQLALASPGTRFDLEMHVLERDGAVTVNVSFDTDLYDKTTIERLLAHYRALLSSAVEDPEVEVRELTLVSPAELHQVLVEWNTARPACAPGTVAAVLRKIEARSRTVPDSVSVVGGETALSYAALHSAADRLAARLRSLGVGARPGGETRVGLCLERSPRMLVALLATWKAGGAYVPLDPSYPRERLSFMLDDAGVAVLITESSQLDRLPEPAAGLLLLDREPEGDKSGAIEVGKSATATLAYAIYTSGSTGRPKGVLIEHRALGSFFDAMDRAVGFEPGGVLLAVTTLSFDIAALELLWPMIHGGRVVLLPRSITGDGAALTAALRDHRPSVMQATPSTWRMVFASEGASEALSGIQILCGGEPLPADLAGQIATSAARALNLYGPTEATIWATAWRYRGCPSRVLLGRPLENTELYLLDPTFRPVPLGTAGEIHLGGDALARGYHGRPSLTASRFVPHLRNAKSGARLYRTGDLARALPSARIEFLGRIDHQVKVRGHRVELGEIETVLSSHPAVDACAVVVHHRTNDVVAYLAIGAPADNTAARRVPHQNAWRAHLREQLPEFMLPKLFIELRSLPLLPSGKADRASLAARPLATDEMPTVSGEAPRTPQEEMIAAIWSEVLGRSAGIGRESDFFALGGHSLDATQVISRLRAAFGVTLAVRDLFVSPTLAALAARVQTRQRGEPASPPPLMKAPAGPIQLSYAQERLWFLDQLEPGNASYNIPAAFRLSGRLDIRALERAIEALVERHEALRASFGVESGQPRVSIAPPEPLPLARIDLTEDLAGGSRAEAARLLQREARRPFHLAIGPLVRAFVLRFDDDEHLLFFNQHHIVSDGWSLGILLRELAVLYPAFRAGQPSQLAPLGVRYRDYAAWQRRWLRGEVLARQVAYWQDQLRGTAPSALPTDRPRPPVMDLDGAVEPVRLSEVLAERLRELCRRRGTTLFMALLSGFQALLYRLTGQRDLAVGTAIAHRGFREIEELVGFFVNTLVLRTKLRGMWSGDELLDRVREISLEAYAHQDLPFEHLVDELGVERDLSRSPLFQLMLVWQNVPFVAPHLPDLDVEPFPLETGAAKFDLTLMLGEAGAARGGVAASGSARNGEGFTGTLEYATAIFDKTTVRRWFHHLETLLWAVSESPGKRLDDLEILTAAESHQLLLENRGAPAAGSRSAAKPLLAAFWACVEDLADAIALVNGEDALSYGELGARVRRQAAELRASGVASEVRVGVSIERSMAMVEAVLAVLEAGGAYVPLAPDYPRERLAFMSADAGLALWLTRDGLKTSESEASSRRAVSEAPWKEAAEDARSLAYVLYTSGSTGRPKGVAMPREGLCEMLAWQLERSAVDRPRTLQFASLSFDVSFQEILSTLSAGGCLVLVSEETRRDLSALLRYLELRRVERLFLPFVALRGLAELAAGRADTARSMSSIREIATAGEPLLPTEQVRDLFRRTGATLDNQYGPTEAHVVTAARLARSPRAWPALPPIGRPLPHVRVYSLDRHLRPVPTGVVGELYLAGEALARGYLERPGRTARRFLPEPFVEVSFPGSRIYRTQDLVRFAVDGALEFLGRADQQVKIRGYRVEPGEIEAVLGEHPGVAQCAVVVAPLLAEEETLPSAVLSAWLVPAITAAPEARGLREYLASRLPEYMVPSTFHVIDALPLNPNGKVDRLLLSRRALEEPQAPRHPRTSPRSEAQTLVAGIWAQVLRLDAGDVGARDDFFALGGHSLLATQVLSRLREAFGLDLPLRLLFAHPTVEDLTAAVERRRASSTKRKRSAPPLVAVPRDSAPESSFAQQRLWFLDRLAPESAVYNMAGALRLEGPLDPAALERTFAEVVRRHETLRTSFTMRDGRVVQVIRPHPGWRLPLLDLTSLPQERGLAVACHRTTAEAKRPFDLAAGPLLRTTLLRLAPRDHVLLLTLHHIISDGWSVGVLVRELGEIYRALLAGRRRSPLPELGVQYADFSRWQRDWLRGPVWADQLTYWRRHLAGVPPLELPTDRPRPALMSFRGDAYHLHLPADLRDALGRLSRARGFTLYMILLAAFAAVLKRHSDQRDFPLGTGIAGRVHPALEELIGFFVNTLALRPKLGDAETFDQVLRRVREVVLEAYDHQDLPFEQLIDELGIEREASRMPLVQVVLVLLNMRLPELVLGDLRLSSWSQPTGTSKFDLTLLLSEGAEGLQAEFEFATDLFDRTTIARMATHFRLLLEAVAEEPDIRLEILPMMSAAERHQLSSEWSGEIEFCHLELFPERFAACVCRNADTVALVEDERRLSYGELDRRANRLGRLLRARGCPPEALVGIGLERSPEMVVAVLAVLKAGGAYLPLEPETPRARLELLLEEARIRMLIIDRRGKGHLHGQKERQGSCIVLDEDAAEIEGQRGDAPPFEIAPENLAYVLHTSGSTGRPKGVMVSHGQLAQYLAECTRLYPLRGEVPLHSPLAFDLVITSLLGPLCQGGRVRILSAAAPIDALVERLRSGEPLSLLKLTPTHLAALSSVLLPGELASRIDALVLGGEALEWRHLYDFYQLAGERVTEKTSSGDRPQPSPASTTKIFNEYGPTEAVVGCAVYEVRPGRGTASGAVPIGRAIRSTRLHVLGRDFRPVPAGVYGELWIGGPGVTRGYLGRPSATAERFVGDPYGAAGTRLYKSGDLVRHLHDGHLEFLGRVDHQVKVRGFRVEPGEIETVLARHPAVRQAVVVPSATELFAYVVAQGHGESASVTTGENGLQAASVDSRVDEWRGLYDDTYRAPSPTGDAALNTTGWTSSYTGELIPADEMRYWRDRTVERILGLRGRRIWEIGCGTGLLLLQIAPRVAHYLGTDFSESALCVLRELRAERGLENVTLKRLTAAERDGVEPGSFDTVVLNSVVQYFPDQRYLRTVLEGAVEAATPDGAVFVGDVRSLPLLEVFRASVERHRAPDLEAAELIDRSLAAVEDEQELILDPDYFRVLGRELPGITQVEIALKRGRDPNEMTRFRYDVVLFKGTAPEPVVPSISLRWDATGDELGDLERRLREECPGSLEVLGIPNARVVGDLAAWQELVRARAVAGTISKREVSVDPESLWELGESLGYRVRVSWSCAGDSRDGGFQDGQAREDLIDVLFERAAPARRPRPWEPGNARTGAPRTDRNPVRLINNPLRAAREKQLIAAWRAFLEERLPSYMVPATFVPLAALPQTASGKIDRAALPAVSPARREAKGYVAPRTAVERRLAAIWAEVLGFTGVGLGENFFDLGGHSLLATQVVARIRTVLGVELPVRSLFEHQTLEELATAAEGKLSVGRDLTAVPLVALPRHEDPALSFAQQRLWFLDRLIPESTVYNMPAAIRLLGPLDIKALERTFGEILRRHEVLRTSFASRDGQPVQKIHPAEPWRLPVIVLTSLPGPERLKFAHLLAEAEAAQPFDFTEAPLLRTQLLQLGREDHVLLITTHHIVCDGWSVGLLLRELSALYAAYRRSQPSPLRELPVQYADYALWQRQSLGEEVLERQIAYWRRQLAELGKLDLPTDRARPAVESFAGARVVWRLDAGLKATLEHLGRAENATLFMTLLAAFEILLSRLAGARDFALGTPVAGRRHPDLESLVGFFVNMLVLRADVAGATSFRRLLALVRATTLAAHDHQDVPFERLVDELGVERDLEHAPLFQVVFALQNTPTAEFRLPGLDLEPLAITSATVASDLALSFTEDRSSMQSRPGTGDRPGTDDGSGLVGVLEYSTDRFDSTTARRMTRQLTELLRQIVEHPARRLEELGMLACEERHQLLREWDRAPAEFSTPHQSLRIQDHFANCVQDGPDRTALIEVDPANGHARILSYGELDLRAERLARSLCFQGVGPDIRVGIAIERSAELLVAVWGTIRAGGTYVPLASDLPAERRRAVVLDLDIRFILDLPTLRHGLETLPSLGSKIPPKPTPDHLVYVISTSGSTGVPKGVGIPHGALAERIAVVREQYRIGPGDRQLQFVSFSFDAWGDEVFPTLTSGSTLVVPRSDEKLATEAFLDLCTNLRMSKVTLPTSYWHQLIDDLIGSRSLLPDSLSILVTGGEAPSAEKLRAMVPLGQPSLRFMNVYGPTEATILTHAHEIRLGRVFAEVGPRIPVGFPVAGTKVYLLDASFRPAPVGSPAELYLGGAGTARGYLNRPGLTALAFVPDPFSPAPGARFYKTGDLARHLSNGHVEILGRRDHQVKVRGFRIELGEVEAALGEHPAVRAVTVLAQEERQGERLLRSRLVAFVVGKRREADPKALRRWLEVKLPAYMIPTLFVPLAALPYLPSGKVDRKRLAGLPISEAAAGLPGDPSLPRTPHEELVAGIWAEVLGLDRIDREADFFALGGHSLSAIRVLSRLRETFGIELELRELFEAPDLAALAKSVEAAQRAEARGLEARGLETRGLEPQSLGPQNLGSQSFELQSHALRGLELRDRADGEPHALSFAQERLWFLDQLEPESASYNVPAALFLRGDLHIEALRRTFEEIERRHEILRTRFLKHAGRPVARVLLPASRPLPMADLGRLTRDEEARRLLRREARRPFALERGGLLRTLLFKTGPRRHLLFLSLHHIASDGWSMGVLVRELAALYTAFREARPSPLPPLRAQYADFAAWQRRWLTGAELQRQVDYWREELAGAPSLELPTDRARPPVMSLSGATEAVRISPEVTEGLRRLCRRHGVTLFMSLLAVFAYLLHRLSGQRDILVGTPVANRRLRETEDLVGFFVNTLVLRVRTGKARSPETSFAGLLEEVRGTALGAYAHQDLPFEHLVDHLGVERDLSRPPLFQVMLTLQNAPAGELRLPGLELGPISVPLGTANFDLTVALGEAGEALAGTFEYATDLFDRTTVARMVGLFSSCLEEAVSAAERPLDELVLLRPPARHQLTREWNDTARPEPALKVLARVRAQAARTPDAVAVVEEPSGVVLSYGAVVRRAGVLARHLQRLGAGPQERVGLFLERSPDMVVGLLGVLESGAAYVPLDPHYPRERLAFMLRDARFALVLTEGSLAASLPEIESTRTVLIDTAMAKTTAAEMTLSETMATAPGGRSPASKDPAYVLYTSGSTGKPKGVLIEHGALANFLDAMDRRLGFRADDVLLAVTTLSFDIAALELFWPLVHGARVELVSRAVAGDARALAARLRESRTSVMQATPTTWRMLHLAGEPPLEGLRVLSGGETLLEDLATTLTTRTSEVWNLYGPTETTIWSTVKRLKPGERVSVGRPLANTVVHLLGPGLVPVPAGAYGEIFLGGAGLARGYHGRPSATAARFVPDFSAERAPGSRLFRTGDLAHHLPNGELDFAGRLDYQVKVRGHRIELQEIETVLARHPSVRSCCAVAENGRLTAFVVPEDEALLAEIFRKHLRGELPEYMIPGRFVELEALPLLPNGKTDRKALARAAQKRQDRAARGHYTAPRTPEELFLAQIWEGLLGVSPVGVLQNFFDLGGTSLLAVQLLAHVEARFEASLPLTTLFKAPTIAELAARITTDAGRSTGPLVALRSQGDAPAFFCVHPAGGEVVCYYSLASHLAELCPDRAFYALRAKGVDGEASPLDRIEDMASYHLKILQKAQGEGPYYLGGWSTGGLVAFEMARRLHRQGEQVARLILFDAGVSADDPHLASPSEPLEILALMARESGLDLTAEELGPLNEGERLRRIAEHAAQAGHFPRAMAERNIRRLWTLFRASLEATRTYVPKAKYPGELVFVRATELPEDLDPRSFASRPDNGWSRFVTGRIEVLPVATTHTKMMEEPEVRKVAEAVSTVLLETSDEMTTSKLGFASSNSSCS